MKVPEDLQDPRGEELEAAGSAVARRFVESGAGVIEELMAEIEGAVFARRFKTELGDAERERIRAVLSMSGVVLNARLQDGLNREGEAGLKRAQLLVHLDAVRSELYALALRLRMVYLDLAISQMDYDGE